MQEPYEAGAGLHEPLLQVEVKFEGQVVGYVAAEVVLLEHVPPFVVAPQAPEAAQPDAQLPYEYGAGLHVPLLQVELSETDEQDAPEGALDEYDVHVPPFVVAPQAPEAAQPDAQLPYEYGAGLHVPLLQVELSETDEQDAPEGALDEYDVHVPPFVVAPQAPEAAQPDAQLPYEYGAGLHVPLLQVELSETDEQDAPEGALDEYDVHVPPFVVAPQAPEAAQPDAQLPYEYGAGLHVPLLQVELSETDEQDAPEGALDEYDVHVPPFVVAPQAPEAAQPDAQLPYEYGAGLHVPLLQVELSETDEQDAPEGALDEYDVHEFPFEVALHPPEAAQPFRQLPYAYGATVHVPSLQVELSETDEHVAGLTGVLVVYDVHVFPFAVRGQPPEAEHER